MSYSEFLKRALTVFALIVLALGFWHLRQILMLAFLSVVVAVSLSIPVKRLQDMGVRRGLAITTTLVGVLLAIILFFLAILPALVIQVGDLVAEFPDAYEEFRDQYNNWYAQQGDMVHSVLPWLNDTQINNAISVISGRGSSVIAGASGAVLNVIANLLFVIVVSVFLLIDPKDYARGLVLMTPPRYRNRLLEIMVELRTTLVAWLTALTFSISITTILVWVLLGWVWGVPNALGLGVIAGVMTIIPNIGAIVPVAPIVIFTIADSPARLPFVLLTYLAIQQLESNVLTPSIVKRQINIPAALIFLFQLIAASIFGFFGILLAVPLLATLITLVREVYVYDTLNQRGVTVDVEYAEGTGLRLITKSPDDDTNQVKVITQTFEAVHAIDQDLPPEDFMEEDSVEEA